MPKGRSPKTMTFMYDTRVGGMERMTAMNVIRVQWVTGRFYRGDYMLWQLSVVAVLEGLLTYLHVHLGGMVQVNTALAMVSAYGIFICFGFLLSMVESKNETENIPSKQFGSPISWKSEILQEDERRHNPLLNKRGFKALRKEGLHKHAGLIPADYSIHTPPPLIDGKPVPVSFSFSLKNIPEINELKQVISVEMNLRIYWRDLRLVPGAEHIFEKSEDSVHSYVNLNPIMLSKLWVPDIYTDYAKSVTTQKILAPPTSLRLHSNGTIRYSSRVLMELSCPMDFRMYPGDSQRCDLRLESYAFTREELSFLWRYEGRMVNVGHRLAHFDFDVKLMDEKGDVNFPSGSYPAIYICLRLHRRLSYHLLQTYVPSSLFVIISWLSYLVPIEYAPGRLAICMTLLLTLTAMFAAIRQVTPSVSYIKALDIWMVGCIVFVFLALAEFAFVLRLDKQLKLFQRKQKKNSSNESSNVGWEPLEEQDSNIHKNCLAVTTMDKEDYGIKTSDKTNISRKISVVKLKKESLLQLRRRLEFVSAIMAPVIFIFFNLCYWPWLLFTPSSNVVC